MFNSKNKNKKVERKQNPPKCGSREKNHPCPKIKHFNNSTTIFFPIFPQLSIPQNRPN